MNISSFVEEYDEPPAELKRENLVPGILYKVVKTKKYEALLGAIVFITTSTKDNWIILVNSNIGILREALCFSGDRFLPFQGVVKIEQTN